MAERRRVAHICGALWLAVATGGYWTAYHLASSSLASATFLQDAPRITGPLTPFLETLPPGLRQFAANGALYGLHLLHVQLTLPVSLCALGMIAAAWENPRRWRRVLMLVSCAVISYLALSVIPLYRNGYAYPTAAMGAVLAAGIVATRREVRRPLLWLMILMGTVQICASLGLMHRWISGEVLGRGAIGLYHVADAKWPLIDDAPALHEIALCVREPDTAPTDIEALATDLRKMSAEACPVLCVAGATTGPFLWYYVARDGSEGALVEPFAGSNMGVRQGQGGAEDRSAVPLDQIPLGAVLLDATCTVDAAGVLHAPGLTVFVGPLQHVRGYGIRTPYGTEVLRLFRIKR